MEKKDKKDKKDMKCNYPQKSWRTGKKRVVKACSGGKEKIIHFGAEGYGHNYSVAARKSFRARHRCSTAKDKLTARYWSCKNLWTKGGDRLDCPSTRICKKSSRKKPRKKGSRKKSSRKKSSRKKPRKKSSRKKSRKGSRKGSRKKPRKGSRKKRSRMR